MSKTKLFESPFIDCYDIDCVYLSLRYEPGGLAGHQSGELTGHQPGQLAGHHPSIVNTPPFSILFLIIYIINNFFWCRSFYLSLVSFCHTCLYFFLFSLKKRVIMAIRYTFVHTYYIYNLITEMLIQFFSLLIQNNVIQCTNYCLKTS